MFEMRKVKFERRGERERSLRQVIEKALFLVKTSSVILIVRHNERTTSIIFIAALQRWLRRTMIPRGSATWRPLDYINRWTFMSVQMS